MEIDKTDGNLYALNKHLEEVEENELRYEHFIEELDKTIGVSVDEMLEEFNRVSKEYGYENYTLEQYIGER